MKVDQQHKPFNPNYNVDTSTVTLHLTFKVQGGQILPKPIKAEIVLARFPYRPTPGTFVMTQLDAQKKSIGSYSIENPLVVRSCDEPGKPGLSLMQAGEISVRLPYLSTALYLQMKDSTLKDAKAVEVELAPVHKQLKMR